MTNPKSNTPDQVDAEPPAAEAFARRLHELRELPAREILHINLDLPSVVATTLGALPRIQPLRPTLEETFRKFDFFSFDALEDYALTLHHTHTDYLAIARPDGCAPDILKEARQLRTTLRRCVAAFALRGLVDKRRLEHLRGTVGHKNLATDLGILASAVRNTPGLLGTQQALVNQSDLDRAAALAKQILSTATKSKATPQAIATAADLRARAFTLLFRAYDDARQGILYIRHQAGDADTIAPSLYAGHRPHKRKEPRPTPQSAPEPNGLPETHE